MSKLKIAIVVSHPIQHFCPMYASWAKNEKVKLKVFFASNIGAVRYHDNNFGKEIKWGNLYLEEFDHHFLNGNKTIAVNKSLDAPDLENQLNSFKPELVIQYGRIYKFNQRLRNWVASNKVKSAYISDSEYRHKEIVFKKWIKKFVFTSYFKKFDLFFSVGDANHDYYILHGVPKEKIIRMNFSIDVNLFNRFFENKELQRTDFRNSIGINKTDIVISVVGKLVKWKNQIHLIHALRILEKLNPNRKYHLLVAGSGPTEQNLRLEASKLKSNVVHFLNFVNPSDLPVIYASSDIYIHPSEFEPHSLAISEAIYMGLPIILSDTSGSYGPTDDVRIGENGEKYTFGNIQNLVECILKLSNSEELRKKYQNKSIIISRQQQQISHRSMIERLACQMLCKY